MRRKSIEKEGILNIINNIVLTKLSYLAHNAMINYNITN